MRRRRLLELVLASALGVAGIACAPGGARTSNAAGERTSGAVATDAAGAGGVGAVAAAERATSTTVIVVRHAEKAAGQGDDPHLSDAGEARAAALARSLADAGITAVITSQWTRTAETAAPTAREAGVTPEVVPVKWDSIPRNAADIAAAVRRHPGGVVLVVGHSNTVPDIVAALGAERPEEMCDSEYDRMEIVTVDGAGEGRLIESRYGAPTKGGAGCNSMR